MRLKLILDVDELLKRFYAADDARSDALARQLMEYTQPHILRYLRYLRVRPDDLEDLWGETRCSLLKKLQKGRDPAGGECIENYLAYAKTVAKRKRLDKLGSPDFKTVSLDDYHMLPANADDNADLFIQERVWEQLWPGVCELSSRRRTAFLLGLKPDCLIGLACMKAEVARQAGLPLSKLRERWHDLPLSNKQIAEVMNIEPSGRESAEHKVTKLRAEAKKQLLEYAGKHGIVDMNEKDPEKGAGPCRIDLRRHLP